VDPAGGGRTRKAKSGQAKNQERQRGRQGKRGDHRSHRLCDDFDGLPRQPACLSHISLSRFSLSPPSPYPKRKTPGRNDRATQLTILTNPPLRPRLDQFHKLRRARTPRRHRPRARARQRRERAHITLKPGPRHHARLARNLDHLNRVRTRLQIQLTPTSRMRARSHRAHRRGTRRAGKAQEPSRTCPSPRATSASKLSRRTSHQGTVPRESTEVGRHAQESFHEGPHAPTPPFNIGSTTPRDHLPLACPSPVRYCP
jgi:hypothetical protein